MSNASGATRYVDFTCRAIIDDDVPAGDFTAGIGGGDEDSIFAAKAVEVDGKAPAGGTGGGAPEAPVGRPVKAVSAA